ncbi:MAG: hypothetical protein ACLFVT_03910, partial [Syntrophobacteria bacterium]
LLQRPLTSGSNARRRIKIGFAYFQVDNVLTLTLEPLRTLEHFHNHERSDFLGTPGNHRCTLERIGAKASAPSLPPLVVERLGRCRAYPVRRSISED